MLHKRSRLPVFVMVKYALGYRVRKAYRAGDREALVVIADDFARTERLLKKFIKSFSAQWNEECKPFGFEKHDLRLGGLLQRLSHCRRRLGEYAEGRSDRIEELEEEILPFRKARRTEKHWRSTTGSIRSLSNRDYNAKASGAAVCRSGGRALRADVGRML